MKRKLFTGEFDSTQGPSTAQVRDDSVRSRGRHGGNKGEPVLEESRRFAKLGHRTG
jgi:hypothetical protein